MWISPMPRSHITDRLISKILKVVLCLTYSQCNLWIIGVIWPYLWVFVNMRVAPFWISWKWLILKDAAICNTGIFYGFRNLRPYHYVLILARYSCFVRTKGLRIESCCISDSNVWTYHEKRLFWSIGSNNIETIHVLVDQIYTST